VAVIVRGLSECERNLRNGASAAKVASQRSVARAGLLVLRELKQRMSGPAKMDPFWGRVGAPGDFMGARTGGTRNRLQGGNVMGSGDSYWTAIGSPDKYVRTAEEGGPLSTSGFFRIPTAAAQTASGVDRLAGQSIRGRAGFRLVRTKAGNLWGIFESARKSTFMYLFKKRITIRGHHVFARTRADAEPKVRSIAGLEVQTVVRVGNGGA
jgi:hypothetical protein